MRELSEKNLPLKGKQSNIHDARSSLLDELKLRFSKPKILLPKVSATASAEDKEQLDRSTGSTFVDNPLSRQKLLDVRQMNDSTSTDISEIDIDHDRELVSEVQLNDHIPAVDETIAQCSLNGNNLQEDKGQNDESWIVKDRPTLKLLWEQLMKERNEHHRTAYTLESLQNMYYRELQKNAILQNTIDKLRFSDGSSCQNQKPQIENSNVKVKQKKVGEAFDVGRSWLKNETSLSYSVSGVLTSEKTKSTDKKETDSSDYVFDLSNFSALLTDCHRSNQLHNQKEDHQMTLKDSIPFQHSEYRVTNPHNGRLIDDSASFSLKEFDKISGDDKVLVLQDVSPIAINDQDENQSIKSKEESGNSLDISSSKFIKNFPNKSEKVENDWQDGPIFYRKSNVSTNEVNVNLPVNVQHHVFTHTDLKSALQLYASLDMADRQSALMRKRSKEMLLYLTSADDTTKT